MSETTRIAREKVVNLAEYRTARAVAALPLLDHADAAQASIQTPARPLGLREVEHRERMLRHLATSTS